MFVSEKGILVEKRGRKVTGLRDKYPMVAGLPEIRNRILGGVGCNGNRKKWEPRHRMDTAY
jgi:hypothetical protein